MDTLFCRPAELKFAKGLLIPKRGTVYEHVFVRKALGGMWCTWQSQVKPINLTELTKVHYSCVYIVRNVFDIRMYNHSEHLTLYVNRLFRFDCSICASWPV